VGESETIIALGTVIVTLAGGLLLSVKAMIRALVGTDDRDGAIPKVAKSIDRMSQSLRRLEESTEATHHTLLTLLERTPTVGEETIRAKREELAPHDPFIRRQPRGSGL
jgi:hypothetical protein